MSNKFDTPGNLIRFRDRDWMVLPSDDEEVLLIKPLGGSDEETTAIYKPLHDKSEYGPATFDEPTPDQIGSFATAKMLFDASRLSFRNASGPFRCMAKLSFRPRAYQLVPLVMALRQEVTRLMIADDVGIGKTIEALIILKELMERGDIKRFAVLCPPHLCEQWAQELKDKLDIEAEIIRSSTAASLDRLVPHGQDIFNYFRFQVVSIDYVKTERRRRIFALQCPELVIVDEAHTCALPEGASSKNQQLRHSLLHDLAQEPSRHIVMLSATPHSGKDSEFQSLLGLLNPALKGLNLSEIQRSDRQLIAKYFVQRKRENIKRWQNEETIFPDRETKEIGYNLSPDYSLFYQNVLRFARGLSKTRDTDNKQTQLLRSWAAIALIRGVMSSPAMAAEMLTNRKKKLFDEPNQAVLPTVEGELFESLEFENDFGNAEYLEALELAEQERIELDHLLSEARALHGTDSDYKLQSAIKQVKQWLKAGHNPIVFCKFVATAHYVAKELQGAVSKKVRVECVTSEKADEQRREIIDEMGESEQRVLVATDCLSEGINLQDYFTAVLHYDLPWNPNRLEQREGRIDRFGQTAPQVFTYVLYGIDNKMDEFVLEVLIKKVRDIHKTTGVTISIGDEAKSLMAKAAYELLFTEDRSDRGQQMALFSSETTKNQLEAARKKGENLRSIFAHENIKPDHIQTDLQKVDEAIGDIATVESFVTGALQHLGAYVNKTTQGYEIAIENLPDHLRAHFNDHRTRKYKGASGHRISFESPTPIGHRYIGRNHQFVEQLCHFVLALAFEGHDQHPRVARASAIQTDLVNTRTVLIMFRVRNVIREINAQREVISEEMYLWGYEHQNGSYIAFDYEHGKKLLNEATSAVQLSPERQRMEFEAELEHLGKQRASFKIVAVERADELVEAHKRFKEVVGGRQYEKATPVLPPDVMGLYLFLPKPKAL